MSSRETYATLIQNGDASAAAWKYVCAAAVLGRQLRLLDPLRNRTVVVHPNLPEYLAAILEEDGLWRIHRAGPRASFRHNRKATLWRLPFRRVFYLDADMQFQTDGPARIRVQRHLHRVWRLQLNSTIRLRANGGKCFNGGCLLLRPRLATADYMDALHSVINYSAPSLCIGMDQKLLNLVFLNSWAGLSHLKFFRALHSQIRGKDALDKYDVYHAYASSSSLFHTVSGRTSKMRPIKDHRAEATAAARWFSQVGMLPTRAQAGCRERTFGRLQRFPVHQQKERTRSLPNAGSSHTQGQLR
tara:strand:- start:153 stop:1055 length:903 start_codon:yes stop_codon:yes gene_type:complete